MKTTKTSRAFYTKMSKDIQEVSRNLTEKVVGKEPLHTIFRLGVMAGMHYVLAERAKSEGIDVLEEANRKGMEAAEDLFEEVLEKGLLEE